MNFIVVISSIFLAVNAHFLNLKGTITCSLWKPWCFSLKLFETNLVFPDHQIFQSDRFCLSHIGSLVVNTNSKLNYDGFFDEQYELSARILHTCTRGKDPLEFTEAIGRIRMEGRERAKAQFRMELLEKKD